MIEEPAPLVGWTKFKRRVCGDFCSPPPTRTLTNCAPQWQISNIRSAWSGAKTALVVVSCCEPHKVVAEDATSVVVFTLLAAKRSQRSASGRRRAKVWNGLLLFFPFAGPVCVCFPALLVVCRFFELYCSRTGGHCAAIGSVEPPSCRLLRAARQPPICPNDR